MTPEQPQQSPTPDTQKTLSETIQEVFRTYEANIREVEKTYVSREEELNLTLN
jgi:hypothetical protein